MVTLLLALMVTNVFAYFSHKSAAFAHLKRKPIAELLGHFRTSQHRLIQNLYELELRKIFMLIRVRSVEVHQVPGQVNAICEHNFVLALRKSVTTERPRFVLDCSKVCEMNSATIRLLLSSLEEAMKRNGDVRLASLHHNAEAALSMSGVSKLFRIYSTLEAASQSFQQQSATTAYTSLQSNHVDHEAEVAA